jgi:hypothetical protein
MPEQSARRYIVSVKRQFRESMPINLVDALSNTEGVRVVGSTSSRAQVEATEQGLASLQARLGQWCPIEEVMDRNLP